MKRSRKKDSEPACDILSKQSPAGCWGKTHWGVEIPRCLRMRMTVRRNSQKGLGLHAERNFFHTKRKGLRVVGGEGALRKTMERKGAAR